MSSAQTHSRTPWRPSTASLLFPIAARRLAHSTSLQPHHAVKTTQRHNGLHNTRLHTFIEQGQVVAERDCQAARDQLHAALGQRNLALHPATYLHLVVCTGSCR